MDLLCIYALEIGMTEPEFWNGSMENLYRHIISYKHKRNKSMEDSDYLAWRTGESVKSALETTAIFSLMVDGKDAKKALKNAKYQELPAFMIAEKKKNKGKPKKMTDDEIKAEREKLFNFINKIKPKK